MADAFDTLIELLARFPRAHFQLSTEHRAPRAPEMLDELYAWLRSNGGEECTQRYQCFDRMRTSCRD